MATKNMAYDHPAYLVPQGINLGTVSGASGVSQRFAAFTTFLIKSLQITPSTAGTSADVFNLITVAGTTTTTTALATFGSGATGSTNVTSTLTLSQGNLAWLVKGADATGVYGAGMEAVIQNLANVTL